MVRTGRRATLRRTLPDEGSPAAEQRRTDSHECRAFRDRVLQVAQGRLDYNRMSAVPITGRSREQVEQFFDGMTLVIPGLVQPQQWRLPYVPDSKVAIPARCGVGIKPAN